MADHEEDEQLKKEFHSWSLKDDRKVCDDMAHNKEKLVERVKDTEDKLNKVSSHVEELSSYVEKLNAMISTTSQAKFLQEDIAEEKLQQAPVEEKVSSSEHVVETMETLRKAIQVGLSTVELFSKEIESVSMMPELIGVFPPLSDAQEPSTRTPVCDMAKQIHTGVNEPVAAVPGEKLMTDFDNSEVKHDTEDDSCDQRYDVKSVEYPSFEGPPLVSSAPDVVFDSDHRPLSRYGFTRETAKIDIAGLKNEECRTKFRQRRSIHVGVRTRKKLSDADSFTKCIYDATRETFPSLLPRKKFAFASAQTKSTYNSVCVACSAGDFNQEKRLRRKLRRQLQQDRDNEWTSRAMEFEKAWEDKNPHPVLNTANGVAVSETTLPIWREHFKTVLNRHAPSAPELERVHRPKCG